MLMVEVMLMVEEIATSRVQYRIVFRFGFSDLIQAWHDSNDGLDEDVAWRHDMA